MNNFKIMNSVFKFKYLYLALILAVAIPCHSQNVFTWKLDYSKITIIDYLETHPGNYVFVGATKEEQTNSKSWIYDSLWILKWNFQGDSLVKTYKPNGYEKFLYSKIRRKADGGYLALGSLNSSSDTSGFIAVGYDSLLNIQWTKELMLPRQGVSPNDAEKLPNGNWAVALQTYNYDWFPGYVDQSYLLVLTEDGQILKIVDDTISQVQQLLLHPDSTRLYGLGNFLRIPGYPHEYQYIMEYDLDLNIISKKPIITNEVQFHDFHGIWLNSDTLLLTLTQSTESSYYGDDIYLCKMLDGDSIVALQEERFMYPDHDNISYNRSICITADNKIINVGHIGSPYFPKAYIGCYDMNLNPIYQWIYDESDFYFNVLSPIATSDSGFIVKIVKYPNDSFTADSIYVIKFDKNGPVAGINELNRFRKMNHLLYPNPGNDYINIELTSDFDIKQPTYIEFVNNVGQIVMRDQLTSRKQILSANQLNAGFYIYRIISDAKVTASGKWIKQ